MPDKLDAYEKRTVVVVPEDALQPLTRNRLKKRKGCCPVRMIAATLAISLSVSGLLAQWLYMEHKLVRGEENLLAIVNNQEKQLAEFKDNWMEQFNEFDDAYTANEKLIRKYRHYKDSTNTNFYCAEYDKSNCKYSSRLAFFYASHEALEDSGEFQTKVNPTSKPQCDEQLESTLTGQIWCNNSGGLDDSFFNYFSRTYSHNPDDSVFKMLKPAAIMLKQGWTDISQHDYFRLDKGKISILQSGIYMIFSRVIFNVNKGVSISYGLWNNGHCINRCRLTLGGGDTINYQQCPTFTVVYLNKNVDKISVKISAFTQFLIGETNFYVGLQQIMPFQLPTNTTG